MNRSISESLRSTVYLDLESDRKQIFKINASTRKSNVELANEFGICSKLEIPNIQKSIKSGRFLNKDAYYYEFFEGVRLKDYLKEHVLNEIQFYKLSQQIAETISKIHIHDILHLRINSNNILIKPENLQSYIIDFSLASINKNPKPIVFDDWGNELAYMAPEQSGHLNKQIDIRTDLYSLGIVLFEIWCGRTPFISDNAAEMVHHYLVDSIPNIKNFRNDTPYSIRLIIEKLLKKNPESRYQSAEGLVKDLNECYNKVISGNENKNFVPGKGDRNTSLSISARLYGRESELLFLKEKYDETLQGLGDHSFTYISGQIGTGKTSLVDEFSKYVVANKGLFIPIHCSDPEISIPNQTIIDTFKTLANYILSQNDQNLSNWKVLVQKAVGEIGQLLIDLAPEFKWIIGEQMPLIKLNINQAEWRLNYLFNSILSELAIKEHPIVLFIDELQLMDNSSWNQLGELLNGVRIPHLMLLGAFTANSKEEESQILDFAQKTFHEHTKPRHLILNNFNQETLNSYVNDSIELEEPKEFCELVYKKTRGNPQYIQKFIAGLHQKKLLEYNSQTQKWNYNYEKIKNIEWAENVTNYMTNIVQTLDNELSDLLSISSCIGTGIKKSDLLAISHLNIEELDKNLAQLVHLDLLKLSFYFDYEFEHESIQKFAYQRLSQSKKSEIHYRIASHWNLSLNYKENPNLCLQLVNQYNRALEHLRKDEKINVIELNYQAGLNSKISTDYDLAYSYFRTAILLSGEVDIDQNRDLTIQLYREAAESGMKLGQYDEANAFLEKSIQIAKTIDDKVSAYEIKLTHYCETHQFQKAIDYLLDILKELGYNITRNPNKIQILLEFLKVKVLLLGKNTSDIKNLKEINNDKAYAFIKLTTMATIAIFGTASDILPIINFKQISESLKYGKSSFLPYSLAAHGFAISVFMDDVKRGHEIAYIALKMTESPESKFIRSKVMVIYYAFLSYWKNPFIDSKEPLKEAYFNGRQTGDLLYACFALSFHHEVRFYAGDNISEILKDSTEANLTIKSLKQKLVYIVSEYQRQLLINLTYAKEIPWTLNSEGFDEEDAIAELELLNDKASTFGLFHNKMVLACIFNAYEEANSFRMSARSYEDEISSKQLNCTSYLLFSAIVEFKCLHIDQGYLKSIAHKIKKLKAQAIHAPINFTNKYLLLEALLLQEQGKTTESLNLFLAAIEHSKKAGFIGEEAIARELLATHLLDNNQQELGEIMLNLAYVTYRNWGALSKCKQLIDKYPDILKHQNEVGNEKTMASFQNIFDLNTIIKSNQILSSENSLDGLLSRMLELVMKNASCTKAGIVLKSKSNQYLPHAIVSQDEILLLNPDTIQVNQYVPHSLIMYCIHSKNEFVSEHLSIDKMYTRDPYVIAHKPISVCCIPIISNQELQGILYLENNLVEKAYDENRIEFFKTITAQLAISIENVGLYSEMEAKVIERTSQLQTKNEELTIEKEKSDNLLLNILPKEVAHELKEKGIFVAKRYEKVTILFIDIKDFTLISEKMEPEELVSELHTYFKKFDEISTSFGLEKIKTMGDAYLAVGGLPDNNRASAVDVINSALQMIEFSKQRVEERKKLGKSNFEIRVGVSTGSVVSGIVGIKKFQFDIWGYAVNVAARMEQYSEPGRINISASTYDLIKDYFNCEYRGKLPAKGLGDIEMYYLIGKIN